MKIDVETFRISKSEFAYGISEADLEPVIVFATDPVAQAHELVGFWYAHFSGSERLSDQSFDMRWLTPWANDLAILKAVDHGADFRIRLMTEKTAKFFDYDGSQSQLSNLRSPYRQALRQVLLRAFMMRVPVSENYDWLVNGRLQSCIACAMPIAVGAYQPSEMVLAVFPRRPIRRIDAIDLPPIDPRVPNGESSPLSPAA
jgi:hypothetical protein